MSTKRTKGEQRVQLHNKKMSHRYGRLKYLESDKEVIHDKDKKAPSG